MAGGFGTQFGPYMAVSQSDESGQFPEADIVEYGPITIDPAAHALHYASECFEGMKAHSGVDGKVRVFRIEAHIERLQTTAKIMHIPCPSAEVIREAIIETVKANLDAVPEAPASAYLRPMLFGTDANIGSAAHPSKSARFMVLLSPVGDYFASDRTLRLLLETKMMRTVPAFGRVKAGANYALALVPTLAAAEKYGVDQVLFAPGGDVQETGAANFVIINRDKVITPALSDSFLHGVTRNSILALAADRGMHVEERPLSVSEVLGLLPHSEAALTGTAAIIASIGEFVYDGEVLQVSDGSAGEITSSLRDEMRDIQWGKTEDRHGWMTVVE